MFNAGLWPEAESAGLPEIDCRSPTEVCRHLEGVRMWKSFAVCWHNRQQFAYHSILVSKCFLPQTASSFRGVRQTPCCSLCLRHMGQEWESSQEAIWMTLPCPPSSRSSRVLHPALTGCILPSQQAVYTSAPPTPCSCLSPPHTLWILLSYRLIVFGLSSHFALSLHFSVSPWVKVWMLVFSQLL